MARSIFDKGSHWLLRFLFFDEVRLLELFSALNLIAWAKVLFGQPDLFQNPAYQGFHNLDALVWAYLFGATALLQIGAMLIRCWYSLEIRFVAMAFAAGAWAVIALNFWQSALSTTAELNYAILAVACGLSGAFLGWKTTSYQS
ncbi:hypothetical protein JI58_03915 [Marinosulfonomonas sp. PRT-SC04]|nr:hypothetical protein JI58_03915 [Marinosulfonomonas sp. PRT-SC04]